jgi:cyclic pyranopterin phosphate synthase
VALFDLYKRRINYLRISVTDRCNLRCLYCVSEKGIKTLPHDEILSFEEILRVAGFAVRQGVSKIRITGGEPLIRRGVVDLIASLHRIPGLVDISLTTNGTLLKRCARPLFDAGIRRINISLDTLDANRFRQITRGGEIADVWAGIQACEAVGFDPIKLNVVALKGVNDQEIPDFIRLSIERPYHVRFIEFMPIGAGPYNQRHFMPTREIMDRVRASAHISPLSSHAYEGPAVRYGIDGGEGTVGFISPVSSHFCESCNRLRLTADGRLRSCLFSDQEINLKKVLRSGNGASSVDHGLVALFRRAVDSKPKGHSLHAEKNLQLFRTMSRIGG